MAKPILIAELSRKVTTTQELKDTLSDLDKVLQTQLKKEYHVLTVFAGRDEDKLDFKCLNDCKGLNNGRIEKLINEYKKLWQDQTSK